MMHISAGQRRWQDAANDLLDRLTGFRLLRSPGEPEAVVLRPPQHEADRLVPSPVFLLSSVRSGSTLLRVLLDSHSQVCAPHETHFRRIQVALTKPPAEQAMAASALLLSDLEHLLWDRLLHRSLVLSGKSVIVEKTPSNVFVTGRLATAWPQARFIFLLRHPLLMARSWHRADPEARPLADAIEHIAAYAERLETERHRHPGLTVRYEDLTSEPAAETRRVCDFLGVEWEPGMLDYAAHDHGPMEAGIGDWSETIHSGRIRSSAALPPAAELPERLRPVAAAWGYPA